MTYHHGNEGKGRKCHLQEDILSDYILDIFRLWQWAVFADLSYIAYYKMLYIKCHNEELISLLKSDFKIYDYLHDL